MSSVFSISRTIDLFHIINELCSSSTCQAYSAGVNNERKPDVSGSSLSDSVMLTIQYIRTNVSSFQYVNSSDPICINYSQWNTSSLSRIVNGDLQRILCILFFFKFPRGLRRMGTNSRAPCATSHTHFLMRKIRMVVWDGQERQKPTVFVRTSWKGRFLSVGFGIWMGGFICTLVMYYEWAWGLCREDRVFALWLWLGMWVVTKVWAQGILEPWGAPELAWGEAEAQANTSLSFGVPSAALWLSVSEPRGMLMAQP